MTDEEYRALQEQSHLLSELAQNPGWSVLVDYIETISTRERLNLLRGNAKTFEEYKERTGYLDGLFKALAVPQTVATMLASEVERRQEHDEPLT
jgi:hypothetical protein